MMLDEMWVRVDESTEYAIRFPNGKVSRKTIKGLTLAEVEARMRHPLFRGATLLTRAVYRGGWTEVPKVVP
jgi:hypothetical protein